nr:elongation of fatty acids protein 3-like [Aegilops tauschii subsp. strangulata]
MAALVGDVAYWLAEHPDIVGFRWSPSGLWFSTWAFLLGFLATYVSLCLAADALLCRRKPLPLGPLPPAHALLMAAVSATIFAGTLLSAVAEIRDTRWSWRGRSRTTPLRWLFCFPPGVEMDAGADIVGGGGFLQKNATSAADRRALPVRYTVNTRLYAI